MCVSLYIHLIFHTSIYIPCVLCLIEYRQIKLKTKHLLGLYENIYLQKAVKKFWNRCPHVQLCNVRLYSYVASIKMLTDVRILSLTAIRTTNIQLTPTNARCKCNLLCVQQARFWESDILYYLWLTAFNVKKLG